MVRVSTKVRYALRAVVEIAVRGSSSPIPIREFAKSQGISPKYAKQLLRHLSKAGIVTGYPGAGGGYVLAKDPDQITVHDLFVALNGAVTFAPCVRDKKICSQSKSCKVRLFWKSLNENFEHLLKSITIGDLARSRLEGEGR